MRRQPAMGCVGFLLVVSLFLPATAAAKETMEVQRFHELLQELREVDPPVMALNPATELVELSGFLSRRLFVETLEAFLAEPGLELYSAAESMLVTELADAYFQANELERSNALLAHYTDAAR
ncbi:MAG: hypothetical protein AUK47_01245 [Deltaproteobacteria bacterium CG2_30_63_29]|nr:MAG: hypothetical protein AUK47_01245 [Deltaproteobacteria bacterium CG2_30_63_29]PJB43253.1 MAG: hypothetical protein CO108_10325 [Deltaproteobacteria bacterium CG_4_9_14_3_um_filter_63_12]